MLKIAFGLLLCLGCRELLAQPLCSSFFSPASKDFQVGVEGLTKNLSLISSDSTSMLIQGLQIIESLSSLDIRIKTTTNAALKKELIVARRIWVASYESFEVLIFNDRVTLWKPGQVQAWLAELSTAKEDPSEYILAIAKNEIQSESLQPWIARALEYNFQNFVEAESQMAMNLMNAVMDIMGQRLKSKMLPESLKDMGFQDQIIDPFTGKPESPKDDRGFGIPQNKDAGLDRLNLWTSAIISKQRYLRDVGSSEAFLPVAFEMDGSRKFDMNKPLRVRDLVSVRGSLHEQMWPLLTLFRSTYVDARLTLLKELYPDSFLGTLTSSEFKQLVVYLAAFPEVSPFLNRWQSLGFDVEHLRLHPSDYIMAARPVVVKVTDQLTILLTLSGEKVLGDDGLETTLFEISIRKPEDPTSLESPPFTTIEKTATQWWLNRTMEEFIDRQLDYFDRPAYQVRTFHEFIDLRLQNSDGSQANDAKAASFLIDFILWAANSGSSQR